MQKSQRITAASLAGLLMFIAGSVIFMGIITAEAYYPTNYSTANNLISDLGAVPINPDYLPSALIFNLSMILAGTLVLSAGYLLNTINVRKVLLIPLSLYGISLLGVGLFPITTTLHSIFATLTFIAGGSAALLSTKVIGGPYKYAAATLGFIALLAIVTQGTFKPYIGEGGIERWTAYTNTLWLLGFGGYVLGGGMLRNTAKSSHKTDT